MVAESELPHCTPRVREGRILGRVQQYHKPTIAGLQDKGAWIGISNSRQPGGASAIMQRNCPQSK